MYLLGHVFRTVLVFYSDFEFGFSGADCVIRYKRSGTLLISPDQFAIFSLQCSVLAACIAVLAYPSPELEINETRQNTYHSPMMGQFKLSQLSRIYNSSKNSYLIPEVNQLVSQVSLVSTTPMKLQSAPTSCCVPTKITSTVLEIVCNKLFLTFSNTYVCDTFF